MCCLHFSYKAPTFQSSNCFILSDESSVVRIFSSAIMAEEVQIDVKDGKTLPKSDNQDHSNEASSPTDTENNQRTVLSFHDLNYKVKVGKPFNKVDKIILRSVTGMFQPGLNAIMGPTGGGKTSLLDLLAKRKDATGLEGDILLNGQPLPKNFRLLAGLLISLFKAPLQLFKCRLSKIFLIQISLRLGCSYQTFNDLNIEKL